MDRRLPFGMELGRSVRMDAAGWHGYRHLRWPELEGACRSWASICAGLICAGSKTKMDFSWDLEKMEDSGQVLFGSTVGCWICHRIFDGELGHAAGSMGYGRQSSMVQKGRAAGSGGDESRPSAGGQMLDDDIGWTCSPT
ncbi:hypothetical protein ACLOJK_004531 [Asimina triloba]